MLLGLSYWNGLALCVAGPDEERQFKFVIQRLA
jgi:hypothetical protein